MSARNFDRKIRVLIAKLGFDTHDAGAVIVSQMLRDAGMEVIYLGVHQTAEKVMEAARQEDVDVIGLSFQSGDHLYYSERLINLIREGRNDCIVLVGGVIPARDIPQLKEMGVAEVFLPGTKSTTIANFIKEIVSVQKK